MASMTYPSYGLTDREYVRPQRTDTFPDRATLVGRDRAPRPLVVECDPGSEVPAWLGPVLSEFERLMNLSRDWDAYGSHPIALEIIEKALEILTEHMRADTSTPWIVPLSNGGIQLEWTRDSLTFEVEVPAVVGERPTAFWMDERNGETWEGDLIDIPQQILSSAMGS